MRYCNYVPGGKGGVTTIQDSPLSNSYIAELVFLNMSLTSSILKEIPKMLSLLFMMRQFNVFTIWFTIQLCCLHLKPHFNLESGKNCYAKNVLHYTKWCIAVQRVLKVAVVKDGLAKAYPAYHSQKYFIPTTLLYIPASTLK